MTCETQITVGLNGVLEDECINVVRLKHVS